MNDHTNIQIKKEKTAELVIYLARCALRGMIPDLQEGLCIESAGTRNADTENAGTEKAGSESVGIENVDIENVDIKSVDIENAEIDNVGIKSAEIENVGIKSAAIDNVAIKSAETGNVVIENAGAEKAATDTCGLEEVYAFAGYHKISAAVGMALKSAGDRSRQTVEAVGRAVRRATVFANAWNELRTELEEEQIWYMPLKGAVLQDYYPAFGMREMSDYDILIDPDRADDVKEIMESLGYTTEHFGGGTHDVYHRKPVLNFEIHKALFGTVHKKEFYEYFLHIKDRLIRCEGNAYCLSPEDFYLFMIAHEYKHYAGAGTGLRSLMDTYMYLTVEKPDLSFIEQEAEKLGIADFEKLNRSLSLHLFGEEGLLPRELPEAERDLLKYILTSGTYGTLSRYVQNNMHRHNWNTLQYILHRLYVPISRKSPKYQESAAAHPNFYRCRIFVLFLPAYRVLTSMLAGRFWWELRALGRAGKKEKANRRNGRKQNKGVRK